MSEYSSILSTSNYNRLINLMAGSLSRNLEKWVWSLEDKVNELGAIALDRDISRIVGIVSEGRYKLREKFVRVAQIVMIIGFEDIQDEEGIEWSLNEEERDRARKIRVDRSL
jgi:conserved oligomeric Golgi complex subunit 4